MYVCKYMYRHLTQTVLLLLFFSLFLSQTLTVSEQLVLISRFAGLIGVHGQALASGLPEHEYITRYIFMFIYI